MEFALDAAASRSRPLTLAGDRKLEVRGALGGLFPGSGLQKGSTVGVGGGAGMSLAIGLAAGVMGPAPSCWAAAVGFPSLGMVAAAELGVPLDRLALVPAPGEQWATVVAALVDGVDLVLLAAPAVPRAQDARRLGARARERGAVLLVIGGAGTGAGRWPESPDVHLTAEPAGWNGLGRGHGHLRSRRVEIEAGGRRMGAGRERRMSLWLPGPGGSVELAGPLGPVTAGPVPASPVPVSPVPASPVPATTAAG